MKKFDVELLQDGKLVKAFTCHSAYHNTKQMLEFQEEHKKGVIDKLLLNAKKDVVMKVISGEEVERMDFIKKIYEYKIVDSFKGKPETDDDNEVKDLTID